MANIDELHWSAILDTKDFDAKADYLRKEAKKLNVELSKMLDIYQKFKGKTLITEKGVENAKQMSEVLSEIKKKMDSLPASVKVYERGTENVNRSLDGTNARYREQSKLLRQLTTLAGTYFSVRGVQSFLKSLIDITGQFEVQKMALTSMLQSSQVADRIFNEYRQLALNSPYTFQDFTKFGKQLTAFNIPENQLVDTTKMLADVAAGLGVDMGRIILAYGQIKSAGVLKGTELRQLTEAGVPILESLAKQIEETTGKTVKLAEVFQMISKKQIPFEMVEKAFRDMTSEGGKFYNMQEVLVETLQGKIGKLRDVWQQMLYDMGKSETINPILKGSIDAVTRLISDYENLGRKILEIVAAYGVYKTALIAAELASGSFALANHKVLSSLASIGKWLAANPYVAFAAALAGAVYAIYKYSTALSNVEKIQKAAASATADANKEAQKEISTLDALYAKLEMAKEGTDEYAKAKKALTDKYGDYIDQLRREGLAVDNLAGLYENLRTKINDATRARALDASLSRIEAARDAAYDDIAKRIEKGGFMGTSTLEGFQYFNRGNRATTKQRQYIEQYVMGGVSLERLEELAKSSEEVKKVVDYINNPYYRQYKNHAKNLRDEWAAVTKTAVDGIQEVKDNIEELFEIIPHIDGEADYPQPMKDWQKKVMGLFSGSPDQESLKDLKFNGTESWQVYRERVGKAYEKAVHDLQGEVEAEDIRYYKARVEFIRNLDRQFGGKLLIGSSMATKEARESASEETKEIQSLNKQAQIIRKYKDVYDSMLPYLGEDTPSALETLFGRKFEDTDFDAQLDNIILRLSELGDAGERAAESLRAALGKDEATLMIKSLEAKEKAAEMLTKYLEKDFGVEGEGVVAKISKLIMDAANKNIKSEQELRKYVEVLEKTERAEKDRIAAENAGGFAAMSGLGLLNEREQEELIDSFWKKYRDGQIKAWKEQMKLEQEANRKLTNEKIVDQAGGLFTWLTKTKGIDLTNWNDKTISQLREIRASLLALKIPEDVLNIITDEDTRRRFIDAFNLLRGGEVKNANTVIKRRDEEAAKRMLSTINSMVSSLKELADATGNEWFSGAMDVLGVLGEIASILSENEQLMSSIIGTAEGAAGAIADGAGDIAGSASDIAMFVKLAALMISLYADAVEKGNQEIEKLWNSYREIAELEYQMKLQDGAEGPFGTNFTRKIENAKKNIDELNEKMRQTIERGSGWSGLIYSWWEKIVDGGGSATDAIANTQLIEKTGWFGKEKWTLQELADSYGQKLFDNLGRVNIELLKIIQDSRKFDDVSSSWLNHLIQYAEAYEEAMGVVYEAVEDIFGDIASSAADKVIDQWIEAGDAALDYADILNDVARTYAKMVIQSSILGNVFDEAHVQSLAQQLMSGDYEGAMATIAEDMQRIADMQPVYEQILQAFDPYFNKGGGSDTLASGIKGITEDTAGLLASYINAMRGDLSYVRMMQEKGWASVESIHDSLGVLPTLNDYMAQVAATNANIAESNRQILERIDRLTTTASGRAALAVDVQ